MAGTSRGVALVFCFEDTGRPLAVARLYGWFAVSHSKRKCDKGASRGVGFGCGCVLKVRAEQAWPLSGFGGGRCNPIYWFKPLGCFFRRLRELPAGKGFRFGETVRNG